MSRHLLPPPPEQMRESLVLALDCEISVHGRIESLVTIAVGRNRKLDEIRAHNNVLSALECHENGNKLSRVAWGFSVAWDVSWQTIAWPHRTEPRREWKDALEGARHEWEKAWRGEPSPVPMISAWLTTLMDGSTPARNVLESSTISGLVIA